MANSNGKSGKHPDDVVIIGTARTPHGRFLGALKSLSAVDLAILAVKAAVERSGIDPQAVDELILGQVIAAGSGQAVARQVWLGAGYPDRVGGLMVNKACGSGLKTIMLASNGIRAGDGTVYVAGGTESMSSAPYLDLTARQGAHFGDVQLRDSLQHDGLWCSLQNWTMGEAAEFIANQFEITREEMDGFAVKSHHKAAAATQAGKFKPEIVPITIQEKGRDRVIAADEPIRPDTTLEALASLKPAFAQDGRVTAGNAPGLNDGASALVITGRRYAEDHHLSPLAKIIAYGQAAVNPQWLFYAPVKAIPVALERAGWSASDVDLFELNEAFAAQVLADLRGLERVDCVIPVERLNVNGGAIALGHPVGASGGRVVVTLIHALKDRGLRRGLAALCLGGGEAVAMALEVE
ncbi:MAG TPA: acetyl-CoA C-acyltransferase [Aggregatilineales bacterium]|nr:acetyl-CoA C-acyltransferase [Aggregatilineales bacterium]